MSFSAMWLAERWFDPVLDFDDILNPHFATSADYAAYV